MEASGGVSIKIVTEVSDPPVLSADDVRRIQHEGQRLHEAFIARTAGMEILTADELKVRVS